jgi:iron(III) transport system ATP-binding protein
MIGITLQNVTKTYGQTLAVDCVSLAIEPGELFFLLGPSGCGKTTLLRMIAGLIDVTTGTIRFGARDVTRMPTGQRNTAMVFQSYALWPHMTVAENVAFGLDVRKLDAAEKKRRVAAALATARMEEFAGRKPAQLSGGQQQRVALARALAVEPDVLLLDEPLSNLDAKLRMQMRSEIRRICDATNVTAVYVTHDQEEALTMADRIAVMHLGRLIQVDTPRALYERPASCFVADFLGQTNFLPATVTSKSADTITLATTIGTIRSKTFPADIEQGGAVTCSIRPESARILANGEALDSTDRADNADRADPADRADRAKRGDRADNTIEGRLTGTVYQGHIAQHTIDVAGTLTLNVNELRPRINPQPGQRLRIAIHPEDVVVLKDTPPKR